MKGKKTEKRAHTARETLQPFTRTHPQINFCLYNFCSADGASAIHIFFFETHQYIDTCAQTHARAQTVSVALWPGGERPERMERKRGASRLEKEQSSKIHIRAYRSRERKTIIKTTRDEEMDRRNGLYGANTYIATTQLTIEKFQANNPI